MYFLQLKDLYICLKENTCSLSSIRLNNLFIYSLFGTKLLKMIIATPVVGPYIRR